MDERLLETFVEVVEGGSFSQASRRLYLSTAGVIKQIVQLEDQVGVPLFYRSSKGTTLTAAGRSLYQDARTILSLAEDAVQRARRVGADADHLIRVVVPTDAPADCVRRVWPIIQRNIPDYRFELISYGLGLEHAEQIYQDLGHKVDALCSVYEPVRVRNRGMEALELCTAPVCGMVPLLHPLYGREKLTIGDLAGETVLLAVKGLYPSFDAIRQVLAAQPLVTIEDLTDLETDSYNRAANEGKVLIDFASAVPPTVRAIPLEDYRAPFGLYYFSGVRPAFREVLDRLRDMSFV